MGGGGAATRVPGDEREPKPRAARGLLTIGVAYHLASLNIGVDAARPERSCGAMRRSEREL